MSNFQFLESHWTDLARLGDLSEKYVYSDPIDYRGRGFASKCLDYAKKIAQKEQCYKMMLLTGSKRKETLDFYKKAGYNSTDKTAFCIQCGVLQST